MLSTCLSKMRSKRKIRVYAAGLLMTVSVTAVWTGLYFVKNSLWYEKNDENSGYSTENFGLSRPPDDVILLAGERTDDDDSSKKILDEILSRSAELVAKLPPRRKYTLFKTKPLVIWNLNHHAAPGFDLLDLWRSMGVRFIQKDLSPQCHHFGTCTNPDDLRILHRHNMFYLQDPDIYKNFYHAYKDDPEMESVDAFLCYDPPAICELYEPFNKSVIIVASNRFNIGRHGAERWNRWIEVFLHFAADPKNVVGANNPYDVAYIRYFTGLKVQFLPSYCGYTASSYSQTRDGYLLAIRPRDEEFQRYFVDKYAVACRTLGVAKTLMPIRSLYAKYNYSDLSAHWGIVHLPYQVSTMSIFEQYRMNIPMFFPSKRLLLHWNYLHVVLFERCESDPKPMPGQRQAGSTKGVPQHPSQMDVPDPNTDQITKAMKYWIALADFYTLPHIIYYDTLEDLVKRLNWTTSAELWEISRAMKAFNANVKDELLRKWEANLLNIAKYSTNNPH